MRALVPAVLIVLAASAPARALPASIDICYATGGPPTNTTLFTCAGGVSGSIVELAAIGFEVVRLSPVASNGTVQQQLVVQRTVAVMRDGFEG